MKVLEKIKNDKATILEMSKKLVVLVTRLAGQRVATVGNIKLKDVNIKENEMCILISHLVKQSKPGRHQKSLKFAKFSSNQYFCVVNAMQLIHGENNSY